MNFRQSIGENGIDMSKKVSHIKSVEVKPIKNEVSHIQPIKKKLSYDFELQFNQIRAQYQQVVESKEVSQFILDRIKKIQIDIIFKQISDFLQFQKQEYDNSIFAPEIVERVSYENLLKFVDMHNQLGKLYVKKKDKLLLKEIKEKPKQEIQNQQKPAQQSSQQTEMSEEECSESEQE